MPQSIRYWLIAATILLTASNQAFASEDGTATSSTVPRAGETPVLRFNVSTTGYPPYVIVGDDSRFSGIAIDVVRIISDRLGYDLELHQIPRKRIDALLSDGRIDATPRAREWTEEPQHFLFTDPIVPIREVFFSTIESDFRFRGLDQLRDVTLVAPLGYHYPQLEPLFASNRLKRYDVRRDRDIFAYLLHGRGMDAGVADLLVGQWIIRNNGWQGKFRHSERAISNVGYRLMLRPDWQAFAEDFNRELAKMEASGELTEIIDQYR